MVTITGILRDPSGAIVADTEVQIRQQGIHGISGGAALPITVSAHSDSQGAITFELLPGYYKLTWRDAQRRTHTVPIGVPDDESVDLGDIIGSTQGVPVRGTKGDKGDPGEPGEPGEDGDPGPPGPPVPVEVVDDVSDLPYSLRPNTFYVVLR